MRYLALLALVVALVGGTLITRQLIVGGAASKRNINVAAQAKLQLAAHPGRREVPFLGPYHKGQCGPGVRIMEGALRHTKPPIRKARASSCIGTATVHQIKLFQKRSHLPQSGIYGSATHKYLSHAYTKQEREALIYIAQVRLVARRRTAIIKVTAHARAYQGFMTYCESGSLSNCGRRFQWPAWPDVPHHTDCSGYVTWVYYQSGLPDPNGLSYTGGYTGTLVNHGIAVQPGGPLHVGDLVFNGPSASNTTHVAIYIGHGLTSGHGAFGIHINQYNYRTVVAIRRYF